MNPDCYETQHQKPHNKLKKAQIPLMENKLSLELKLGGGSTNPRSKGTPQPPLKRKSIRGAFLTSSAGRLWYLQGARGNLSCVFSLLLYLHSYGSSVDFHASVHSASSMASPAAAAPASAWSSFAFRGWGSQATRSGCSPCRGTPCSSRRGGTIRRSVCSSKLGQLR